MSDTPWTPGPWTAKLDWLEGDRGYYVQAAWDDPHDHDTTVVKPADARLIAAAPEMADVLERWWNDPDNPPVDVPLLLCRIRGEA